MLVLRVEGLEVGISVVIQLFMLYFQFKPA